MSKILATVIFEHVLVSITWNHFSYPLPWRCRHIANAGHIGGWTKTKELNMACSWLFGVTQLLAVTPFTCGETRIYAHNYVAVLNLTKMRKDKLTSDWISNYHGGPHCLSKSTHSLLPALRNTIEQYLNCKWNPSHLSWVDLSFARGDTIVFRPCNTTCFGLQMSAWPRLIVV
jgi:hypothetical protein